MLDCDSSLFMNKDEPSQCKVSGIISLSSNMFDFSHICHQFPWLGLFLADGDKLDPWFNSAFNYLAHWKRNILHSTTFIWGITYSRKREKTVWEFCSKNSDFGERRRNEKQTKGQPSSCLGSCRSQRFSRRKESGYFRVYMALIPSSSPVTYHLYELYLAMLGRGQQKKHLYSSPLVSACGMSLQSPRVRLPPRNNDINMPPLCHTRWQYEP